MYDSSAVSKNSVFAASPRSITSRLWLPCFLSEPPNVGSLSGTTGSTSGGMPTDVILETRKPGLLTDCGAKLGMRCGPEFPGALSLPPHSSQNCERSRFCVPQVWQLIILGTTYRVKASYPVTGCS